MLDTKIISIDDYDYILFDGNKEYMINIEFHGLDIKLKTGDTIYISKKLLRNNKIYCFGDIKENKNNNMDEYIKIESNDKIRYLQRYYG